MHVYVCVEGVEGEGGGRTSPGSKKSREKSGPSPTVAPSVAGASQCEGPAAPGSEEEGAAKRGRPCRQGVVRGQEGGGCRGLGG